MLFTSKEKKHRFKFIGDYFIKSMPNPTTELQYESPFQLLIAVVLSAQCTDKRINEVTPALFRLFPTPQKLEKASYDQVYSIICSVSYPHSKTRYLLEIGKVLIRDFNSQVPGSLASLVTLAGVGRKTANVILATIFNKPAIGVDTHVFRLSKRIGLVDSKIKCVDRVEQELMQNIPLDQISRFNHWMVLHGRYICKAKNPLCNKCPLSRCCKYYAKKNNEDK